MDEKCPPSPRVCEEGSWSKIHFPSGNECHTLSNKLHSQTKVLMMEFLYFFSFLAPVLNRNSVHSFNQAITSQYYWQLQSESEQYICNFPLLVVFNAILFWTTNKLEWMSPLPVGKGPGGISHHSRKIKTRENGRSLGTSPLTSYFWHSFGVGFFLINRLTRISIYISPDADEVCSNNIHEISDHHFFHFFFLKQRGSWSTI